MELRVRGHDAARLVAGARFRGFGGFPPPLEERAEQRGRTTGRRHGREQTQQPRVGGAGRLEPGQGQPGDRAEVGEQPGVAVLGGEEMDRPEGEEQRAEVRCSTPHAEGAEGEAHEGDVERREPNRDDGDVDLVAPEPCKG